MSANQPFFSQPTTRREFLKLGGRGLGMMAFCAYAPNFLVNSTRAAAPAPEKDQPILVLVQLAGGNDGLNTLIPFEDPNYYRLRPTLGLSKDKVLRVNDTLGLHPSCTAMHDLMQQGKLAAIQNVGYPNPNRSHFRSSEIWETGSSSNDFETTGWIGRYLDNACSGVPADSHDPLAVHMTSGVPESFLAAHEHPTFGLVPGANNRRESEDARKLLESLVQPDGMVANTNANFLRQTLMDSLVTEKKVQQVIAAYRPAAQYPGNPFAASLRSVAALISGGLPTRVYFVSLSGFDTHGNQLVQQANLLGQLSDGLSAFQKDLEAHKLDQQVLTMTFSEFGRRPSENESRGTDHGTAAPLFVMGSKVKGGLHGSPPNLKLAHNEDLTFTTDFRQVYSTVLKDWMHTDPTVVLGKTFETMDFV